MLGLVEIYLVSYFSLLTNPYNTPLSSLPRLRKYSSIDRAEVCCASTRTAASDSQVPATQLQCPQQEELLLGQARVTITSCQNVRVPLDGSGSTAQVSPLGPRAPCRCGSGCIRLLQMGVVAWPATRGMDLSCQIVSCTSLHK